MTDMKRFDLMHQINARGTFMVSKFAVPHLAKADNPHILMLSPPLDMKEKWFSGHTAYSMAKFGMSLVVLGLAGELRSKGIAVNALWPRTTIATSAVQNLLGGDAIMQASRTPEILADAAHLVFTQAGQGFTGHFMIDDTFADAARARGARGAPRRRSDATSFRSGALGLSPGFRQGSARVPAADQRPRRDAGGKTKLPQRLPPPPLSAAGRRLL
jgi:NAD(P)-dependent dehydrogenase (short-subunit alcohol dehydrogenase family)